MSLGAGFSAAGFSPAGFGDVDQLPSPATENLVDAKGVQQNARAIDPVTGQYVLNADGRFQGMPRVEQLVVLLVRAMQMPSGDVTPNMNLQLKTLVTSTLAPLVNEGLVAILDVVSYLEQPSRARAALKYRDLTTGREVLVPL